MADSINFQEILDRQAQREKQKKRKKIRYAVWLLLFAVVVYIVVQVVLVLTPKIRREVAILETMTDSITAQGFVSLESQAIESGTGGVLYYTVDSGERVSAGTAIAAVYANQAGAEARGRLQELDAEIERLGSAARTNALSGDTETYMAQLQKGLVGMLAEIATGNYTGVSQYAGEAELAANKLQLATGGDDSGVSARLQALEGQRQQYESLAVAQDAIIAPTTGYFVQASGKDRVPMAYDTLAGMDVAGMLQLLDNPPEYYGSNVAGYIISDYKWSLFAVVTAEEAERFTVGSKKLSISFAEIGTSQLPVTVQSIERDEASGYAVVELYCEYMSPEILKMQNQTVQIIFSVQSGVRIPKEALRVYEGEEGVFVVFGNIVYFRRVEILLESDYYILVPTTTAGVNQVKLYDEIIVDSGGAQLEHEKPL